MTAASNARCRRGDALRPDLPSWLPGTKQLATGASSLFSRALLRVCLAGWCAALGVNVAGEEAQPFKLVVNVANPVERLTRQQVSSLFLKKVKQWPRGEAALPVDQSAQSLLRHAFTQAICKAPMSAIRQYWERQIFSGGEQPPPVVASDAEVLRFVSTKHAAVGYVGAGTPLPDTVRALVLSE